MASLNEVRLIGRLTRDPELKTTPNGHSVATFGLATNRRYRGSDGGQKEEVAYIDIVCWGYLAENVHRYLSKGRQAFVGGRLQFESWEDKQTGQKRSRLKVVAENVQFLDRGSAASDSQPQSQYAPQSQYNPQSQYTSSPQRNLPPADEWASPESFPPLDNSDGWSDSPPMDEPPF